MPLNDADWFRAEYPRFPRHPLEVIQYTCGYSQKELASELELRPRQLADYIRGKSELPILEKTDRAIVLKFGLRPDSMRTSRTWPSCLDMKHDNNVPQWILAWKSTSDLVLPYPKSRTAFLSVRTVEASRKIDVVNGKVQDPNLVGTAYDVSKEGIFNILSDMPYEDAFEIIPTRIFPPGTRNVEWMQASMQLGLPALFRRYADGEAPDPPIYYFQLARRAEKDSRARRPLRKIPMG